MEHQNYSLHYYRRHEIFSTPSCVECLNPFGSNGDDGVDDDDGGGGGGGGAVRIIIVREVFKGMVRTSV